jgi:hypothetical protein
MAPVSMTPGLNPAVSQSSYFGLVGGNIFLLPPRDVVPYIADIGHLDDV